MKIPHWIAAAAVAFAHCLPVAAASLIAPEVFTFEPARLRVAVEGPRLGRVERIDGAPNAEVCTGLDVQAVRRLIVGGLFGAQAVEAA